MKTTRRTVAALAPLVLTLGLLAPGIAGANDVGNDDRVISTDTTYDNTSVNLPGDYSVLVVTHGPNDPLLTLTNDASLSGAEGVIVGSGNGESGQLLIEGGSVLTNSGPAGRGPGTYSGINLLDGGEGYVGLAAGATGTATVTGVGSTWNNSDELDIGYAGTGTFNIEDGASVSSYGGFIGRFNGAQGTVTVNGDDSSWTTYNGFNYGDLIIGQFGAGELNIESGASVTDQDALIGRTSPGQGIVLVTGAGSTWTNHGSVVLSGRDLSINDSGSGTLTITSGGVVNVGDTMRIHPGGTVNLYAGGTLNVNHFKPASGTFNFTGGTLRLTGKLTADLPDLVSGAVVELAGPGTSDTNASMTLDGGTLHFDANITSARDFTVTANGGVFDVNDGRQTTLNGAITGNGDMNVTGDGDLTLTQDLGGQLSLNMTGSGTLRLEGANFIDGARLDSGLTDGTIVLAGSLALVTDSSLEFLGGTLRLDTDSVGLPAIHLANGTGRTLLDLNGHSANPGTKSITGPGHLTVTGSGALNFFGGQANTHGGFIVENGATLRIDHANQLGAVPGAYQLSNLMLDGGTLEVGGDVTVDANRGFYLIGDGNTITTQSGRTVVLPNVIASYADPRAGGSLTVGGGGTLVLTGDNTYSRSTTITSGTLLVNNTTGSGTGTGEVHVTGGTLGGNGAISGAVSVGADGTLAPGHSIGSLTAGGLALESGASLGFEIDSPDSLTDLLEVLGTVNLNDDLGSGGDLLLTLLYGAPTVGQSFTLIDNDGTDPIVGRLSQGNLATADFGGQTYRFAINYAGGDGNDLTLTAVVPEPDTLALLGLGGVMLLGRRGRRPSCLLNLEP